MSRSFKESIGIREQLRTGRQAFVVCPRVEVDNDEESEIAGSVEAAWEQLSNGELDGFRVGYVHGQLDRDTKADAMESFRSGKTQVLVSTTVTVPPPVSAWE